MTTTGADLLALAQDMRALHFQVARLLDTTEDLMRERGWKVPTDRQSWAYLSASLDNPKQWMPSEFFRFFRSESTPSALAFVSVVLLPHAHEEGLFVLTEPIVSAGWFRFEAVPAITSSHQWYSRWHCYTSRTPSLTGDWVETRVADLDLKDREAHKYEFDLARTFGRPLVQITGATDLEELVVRPLVSDITMRDASAQK